MDHLRIYLTLFGPTLALAALVAVALIVILF